MKTLLISILIFLTSTIGYANYIAPGSETVGPPNDSTTWSQYHASDHFDLLRNSNDVVHLTIGFGASYILSDVLYNKAHLSKLETWVLSTLIISTIGVVKETYIDNFSSKADAFGWQLGASLGATTFLAIHF